MPEKEPKRDKKDSEEQQPQRKGPSIKLLLIVAALMILEGVAVFVFVGMTVRGPADADAAQLQAAADAEGTIELELLGDRFPNMSTGQVWLWDVQIALKVKRKHAEQVQAQLENHRAEITDGVGRIIRKAAHDHLAEPGLETMRRQLTAFLNTQIPEDPVTNESRIEEVLIPKCRGNRA